MLLQPDDGAWVPVRFQAHPNAAAATTDSHLVVQPLRDTPWDVVPGVWDPVDQEGVVFLCNLGVLDIEIVPQAQVAALVPASLTSAYCRVCDRVATDAWLAFERSPESPPASLVCCAEEPPGPHAMPPGYPARNPFQTVQAWVPPRLAAATNVPSDMVFHIVEDAD